MLPLWQEGVVLFAKGQMAEIKARTVVWAHKAGIEGGRDSRGMTAGCTPARDTPS
ncbi:hypothetical protein BIFGAL_04313 [Bifidobacterium gallicum DSM 20093 = LMG 11596]|uniref:Uncharacterized protein n=1 Tax=Bifidobacterium gallicum DSM 20093 = LMG 11596 TaxID=561180 RepID=D1NWQ9_9BIFI|nr:hypothetical protein BIFGAL_04313 [Bifidobacterium gallicum DSM 20093 = LMG 11596]